MRVSTRTGAALAALTLTGTLGLTTGCNDYATDGCSPDAAPPVPDFHAGPGVTDVTFLAFGDSQIFLGGDNDDGGRKNDLHVQALNVADTLRWDALGLDEPVDDIRGVLMAGDITQIGRDWRGGRDANEYGVFADNYGLCGNRILRFHMYEGYGNHDFRDEATIGYGNEHPVADSVGIRNAARANLANQASESAGHYSWDWDGVHFVNVNLAPSDVVPDLDHVGLRDPRGALSFLIDDLAAVGPDRPVVIMHHYQPNGTTFEWDAEQIDAYAAAIAGYDVIAIIHGHRHNTSTSTWNVNGGSIPVFNVGSPYYQPGNGEGDGRGHFAVIRITDDRIYAFHVAWGADDPTALIAPDDWSRVVDLAS